MRLGEPLSLHLASDAICLCLLQARGMTLHPYSERETELQGVLVGQAELLGQLVNPYLSSQLLPHFSRSRATHRVCLWLGSLPP